MDRRRATAAAVGVTVLVFAVIGRLGGGTAPVTAVSAAAMPSYCGTKATERLPECGWTEGKQAPASKDGPATEPKFPQTRLDAMGALVRVSGYSCKTPINARNMLTSASGFVLHCEGDRPNSVYWYDIEDRGGRLVVAPR